MKNNIIKKFSVRYITPNNRDILDLKNSSNSNYNNNSEIDIDNQSNLPN